MPSPGSQTSVRKTGEAGRAADTGHHWVAWAESHVGPCTELLASLAENCLEVTRTTSPTTEKHNEQAGAASIHKETLDRVYP